MPTNPLSLQARRAGARRLALAAALVLVAMASARADESLAPPRFQYVCYRARTGGGASSTASAPQRGLALADRFATQTVDLTKSAALCDPAETDGDPPRYNASYLEGYLTRASRKPRQPAFVQRDVEVLTRLGTLTLHVRGPDALLVPSSSELVGQGPQYASDDVQPLRCYDVDAAGNGSSRRSGELVTVRHRLAIGQQIDVREPTRLCVPASVAGDDPAAPQRRQALLCRRARLAKTKPAQAPSAPFTASVHNQFGDDTLRALALTELCESVVVGALANPCPAPSPTPTVTATPQPSPDRLTLQRISLSPPEIARMPGESKRFIATGWFPGDVTLDLSQEVTFASSDPTVATAPNEPPHPNRIDLVGRGTTTISATDPLTGVRSTDSGGDAILHATGPLQSIEVSGREPKRFPCGFDQFTAVGHYEGGFTRNITQDVIWSTTDPDHAIAPNLDGDRSRVIALRPGTSGVVARDPATGITSECCPFLASYCCPIMRVLGVLDSITLLEPRRPYPQPYPFSPARAPEPRHLIARAHYADGTGSRTVTEEVQFVSSNPSAVQAPNELGDRGKLLTVGPGTAEIRAVDPDSGITSEPHSLRSLAGLTRVEIPYHVGDHGPFLSIGGIVKLEAIGHFGDGPAPLKPTDVKLVSTDPTIASTYPGSPWVLAVSPGHATISAVDIATGISSEGADNVVVGVRGALQRLRLEPKTILALPGQHRDFTALAEYVGGVVEVVSKYVIFSSSDPTIAEAPNDYLARSRVVAKSAGTAVISAEDPYTHVRSTDTGDDASITVLKPLKRITITPPQAVRAPGRSYFYAAIGEDLDGNQINLTQDVEWTSSHPEVARAANDDGERSRVDTLAAGETTISAREPLSGISSTDADRDSVLTVTAPLVRLVVSSEITELQPGWEWQVTTNGEDGVGGVNNLTQEVTYASSNESVVKATNEDGMRSRIVAIAPGTATISATDPLTGLHSTNGGIDVTITVVAP